MRGFRAEQGPWRRRRGARDGFGGPRVSLLADGHHEI